VGSELGVWGMSRAVMQQALEALTIACGCAEADGKADEVEEAIAALRAALAEPQAEHPVQALDERATFEAWAEGEQFCLHRDDSEKYREYHRATTRWAWQAWQARAALASAPQVPQGWKLVPVEPTKDMVEAAYDNVTGGGGRAAIYAAMLAAAPAPEGAQQRNRSKESNA
jgi:hypothetical protein